VFRSLQCLECGKYNSCIVKNVLSYTFKCRYCGKSTKLYDKRKGGVRLNMSKDFSIERDCVSYTLCHNGR
jgi:transcription elongation factor Elf1